MKIVAYIPARLKSTRLPNKVIQDLQGKPLVQWAYENALQSGLFSDVVVAVDDPIVEKIVEQFGGKTIMTDPEIKSGTKRIIQAIERGGSFGEVIVNLQADEPFIDREVLKELLQSVSLGEEMIWTLRTKILSEEEKHSSDVVKVVTDEACRALYFSRSPIPFDRDGIGALMYRHVGLYAYTLEALNKISTLQPSYLEEAEKLEQLTPLMHGIPIYAYKTLKNTIGIDTLDDLEKARKVCLTSL